MSHRSYENNSAQKLLEDVLANANQPVTRAASTVNAVSTKGLIRGNCILWDRPAVMSRKRGQSNPPRHSDVKHCKVEVEAASSSKAKRPTSLQLTAMKQVETSTRARQVAYKVVSKHVCAANAAGHMHMPTTYYIVEPGTWKRPEMFTSEVAATAMAAHLTANAKAARATKAKLEAVQSSLAMKSGATHEYIELTKERAEAAVAAVAHTAEVAMMAIKRAKVEAEQSPLAMKMATAGASMSEYVELTNKGAEIAAVAPAHTAEVAMEIATTVASTNVFVELTKEMAEAAVATVVHKADVEMTAVVADAIKTEKLSRAPVEKTGIVPMDQ